MSSTMPAVGLRPAPDVANPADIVVRNARIYTGDRRQPTASAVAISGGVFTAVGDDAAVAGHVGVNTRTVDGLGRRVIPGLNDSHMHIIRGGVNYLLELRWDGVRSLRVALAMLRQQAGRTPAGQWVRVVGGWTANQFLEQRMPTASELNAAAPDTPVLVLHLYQSAILNRAAVEAIGFTKKTPDPPGGEIVRDHAGNPTGVLLAAPAPFVLYAVLAKTPALDPEQQVNSTRHFMRELNRFGLTSAIDAAGGSQNFPDNYGAVMQLAEHGELTVRLAYHLLPQTPGQELDDLRRWIGMVRPGQGDQWLRANGAGEVLTLSTVDFENFSEPRPELAERAATDLEAAVRLLIDNDWPFRIHATYGETIERYLDVFDRIAADRGFPGNNRWFFDHAETVTQRSLDRIKALGGAISIQNRMMFQGRTFAERYGAAAAATAPPVRAMLDTGLLVGAGTDGTRASSYNPWLSLSWLVTGRDIAGLQLYPPANRVDRETALRMYTIAGAELTGEDGAKGTITTGKYADLAILSADYFAVPESDISRIESVLTIAGGKIVYAAADYEAIAAPLPGMNPSWTPVAQFGGYQSAPAGVQQARAVLDAATESQLHRLWRQQRGELDTAPAPSRAPDLTPIGIFDACF